MTPFFVYDINESFAFKGAASERLRPDIYKNNNKYKCQYDYMLDQDLTFLDQE